MNLDRTLGPTVKVESSARAHNYIVFKYRSKRVLGPVSVLISRCRGLNLTAVVVRVAQFSYGNPIIKFLHE